MEEIFKYKDCISIVDKISSVNVYGTDKIGTVYSKFTIAIPTFNRVSTLGEAIDSALGQEGFDNYNIVVVDNNPKRDDETEIFMRKYEEHPKVTYYKNTSNVGMAGNWNKCMLLSASNKVVLLHDDDIMSPYCLKTFNWVCEKVEDDWALIKPSLPKFSKKEQLQFKSPTRVFLNKLHKFDFYNGCSIGAPSVILMNKKMILPLGGYDQNYFPSYDYVMTSRLIMNAPLYIVYTDNPLGGYRVACNESLSPKTMDMYFSMRYKIGAALMRKNGWHPILIKTFHSLCYKGDIAGICKSYNMSSYTFKGELNMYKIPMPLCRIAQYIYQKSMQILRRLNRKKIY